MKGHPPDCFCETCRGEDAINQPPPWSDSEPSSGLTDQQKSQIFELIHSELMHAKTYLIEQISQILGKQENEMLPRNESAAPGTGQEGGSRRRNKSGQTFLSNEMLSTTPKEARIIAVRYEAEHRFGPSVVLKISLEGKVIFWTVNVKKNPNYGWLTEELGHDENDWTDKKILLFLEEDEFTGNYFVRVDFPETKKKGGKEK